LTAREGRRALSEINGRAAVVTGAGSGIGMGLAKELARQNASVAVADIIEENAAKVAEEINASGGKAVAVHCDVCERASIAQLRDTATAALGPIQLVFANAGATSFDPLMEMSDDDVDWILQVNLHGVMNTVRAFLPGMMEAGSGHICATASTAGLLPGWIPVHVPYSAAKMGVIGLMMNLALEMKAFNVGTTIYCPGGVATGMKDNNSRYRPARFGGPTEETVHIPEESFKGKQIAFLTPDEIAPLVLRAVKNDRPFVFDHPEHVAYFRDTYASLVEAGYAEAHAYFAEQAARSDD
jgi:NAD(P)-dependent dehydrogenase (short-subunit alcohol dehydrogenase family)